VTPLPAATHTASFNVQWSGQSAAGIAAYDVYAAVDGGPLTIWLTGTTLTQATYNGMDGHSYGFAVVAIDPLGNRSTTPTSPQTTTLVQTTAPTSIQLQATAIQVVVNQPVNLNATVTSSASWAGTPAGSVQFLADGQPLGAAVPLDAGGVATLPPVHTLAAGSHQVTAAFMGTAPFLNSSGGPLAVTVNSPSISASVAPLPAVTQTSNIGVQWSGQSTTGIAGYDVYAAVDGGPLTIWLTGTSLTQASYTGMNGHSYGFAVVAIDPFGNRSATPASPQATTSVQTSSITATTLQANLVEVTTGAAVSFTATVTAQAAGAGPVTGLVQFLVDGQPLGAPVALTNGTATSQATTTLAVGTHQVTAAFMGNGPFLPSSSAVLSETVNALPSVVHALGATFSKTKGKITALAISFNGALDPTSAQAAGNYALAMVVKGRGRKPTTHLVRVPLGAAVYSSSSNSVRIATIGHPKSGAYQLTIVSSQSGGVHDTSGQPLIGGNATIPVGG
jgi:fibronectin type 3 domain-containing protein